MDSVQPFSSEMEANETLRPLRRFRRACIEIEDEMEANDADDSGINLVESLVPAMSLIEIEEYEMEANESSRSMLPIFERSSSEEIAGLGTMETGPRNFSPIANRSSLIPTSSPREDDSQAEERNQNKESTTEMEANETLRKRRRVRKSFIEIEDGTKPIPPIPPQNFSPTTNRNCQIPIGEIQYLLLYKAALRGDWEAARIFLADKGAQLAKLTKPRETALHIAVSTGRSRRFVCELVELMDKESLGEPDKDGDTPLHYAAQAGNTDAAKILVKKNPSLPQKTNNKGITPLHAAAKYAQRKTVCYLRSVTQDKDPSPFVGEAGVKLLNLLITADFYDIALDLLKQYPSLALERDPDGKTALLTLVQKPDAFEGRNNHQGLCQRLWSHLFAGATSRSGGNSRQGGDVENPIEKNKQFRFPPCVEKKCLNRQAVELLELLISEISEKNDVSKVRNFLIPPVRIAARLGIHKFVVKVIKAYPNSIWIFDENGMSIFHLAVKHRQEDVFSLLLHHMSLRKHFVTTSEDKFGNNLLHLAGELQPSNKVSGAALQMQGELQWFQEVEKVVMPSFKEKKNDKEKTPREVFTDTHKGLMEHAEKWMKDTATSYAFVAALVVTVVFAAAFTVPGGNNQNDGIPIFLKETSFIIFVILDTLALFSSATALLMFLGILTSRYSEKDFLKSLPKRLSIGLITLFFSITSMLAAFSASLHIVLSDRVSWIAIPIGLLALMPIILFAFLQFPLLVEIVSSTFGPSIFRKQNEDIIM